MKLRLVALALSLGMAAPGVLAQAELPPPLGDATAWKTYGQPVRARRVRSLEKVLSRPGRHLSRPLVMEGRVVEVCAKKGCWMALGDGERQVRVTFEGYGFFVPRDIEGATARVAGILSETVVPVEDVRHYLEDAGRHEEAARVREPERTLTFEATGVMLRRPAP